MQVAPYAANRNGAGKVTQTICVLEVLAFHINKGVYNSEMGAVDTMRLKPIARLGGDATHLLVCSDIARPNKDGSPGKLRFG